MEKQISDKEIMSKILDALKLNGKEFSQKLKYKSHNSVYNVTKGKNDINNEMMNRILMTFPDVSYLFLKKGQGEPLRYGAAATMQKNILNLNKIDGDTQLPSIQELLSMPERVRFLENIVLQLRKEVELLKK